MLLGRVVLVVARIAVRAPLLSVVASVVVCARHGVDTLADILQAGVGLACV